MRNKSVDVHQFAMVPRADIPRSSFLRESSHKTTFDAGYLVPIYVDEVLPGDTFKMKMTAFARMSTPIYPVMDNLRMEVFIFFVPNRLLWTNWKKMMGEQANPTDSISFLTPTTPCPVGGHLVGSLQDYMGLPTVGQVDGAGTFDYNSFHTRAYNLIWNEWFRDENLQNSVVVDVDDGPDNPADYVLLRRGKRHDYFTSALPWPQKGNTSVSLPLGTSAAVKTGVVTGAPTGAQGAVTFRQATDGAFAGVSRTAAFNTGDGVLFQSNLAPAASVTGMYPANLYADLSTATAATINQIRQAFQIQKLLERDARGGTRYTEIVRAHFGVTSPDARLQRPEYLGGGSFRVNVSPIAQNTQTGLTGGATPLGTLGAMATAVGSAGFTQSFTEHGVLLGLVSVRADLNYQQGLRRMWTRRTRYDFYVPAFAMLGEQGIFNYEIYCTGLFPADTNIFGYQERWADYRYMPSMITGLFRSTSAGTLDAWHLAQKFATLPLLNSAFIQDTPPLSRVLAVGAGALGQQFIFDSVFSIRCVRPMPMYSVPGLLDHF